MDLPADNSGQSGRLRDIAWCIEYTGLSRATINRLIKENRIPVTKVDRFNRFDIVAIDKWINRHTSSPERAA